MTYTLSKRQRNLLEQKYKTAVRLENEAAEEVNRIKEILHKVHLRYKAGRELECRICNILNLIEPYDINKLNQLEKMASANGK